MSVVNVWVGGVTPTTARITTKVTTGPTVRVAVADNSGMVAPVFHGPESTVLDVAQVTVTGLDPDTQYWFQIEDNAVLDATVLGSFRTHPPVGEPASFAVWAAGDAGLVPDFPDTTGLVLAPDRQSNAPVFETIRNHPSTPLFGIHIGDMHYYDLGSGSHGIIGGGSLDNYRRSYDDVLLQSRQHELYRTIPFTYVWDDHDFGPNNSDGTLVTKANAAQAYRERVPSYDLPDAGAIYHAFQVGRVLFVNLDNRFYRDPEDNPDGPGHTLLGSVQMAWLADLLETSTAEALVLNAVVQWMTDGPSPGSWTGYAAERQAVADLLTEHGWAGRMVMIAADAHKLAMDDGANNPVGGWPVYILASLDASPSSGEGPYNIGSSNARDQYGIINITDDGDTITIKTDGYRGNTVQMSHTVVIDTTPEPPEPPEPGPELPTVAIAEIRTEVTWLGCDLVSGQIIAELPDITGQVSRVLGAYTSANLTIPIPLGGPAHIPLATVLQAIDPARTMVVAVVNDIPTWAGIALLDAGGTDAVLSDGLVSLEGYLRHRFVRDHTWTGQDEAGVIAAGLLGDAEAPINGLGGGIGLTIDAPPTGTLRDRTYLASDHKSVYDALTELMAVQDGPEWTIDLDWTDTSHTAIAKIARVRKRIGVAANPPTALFQTTAGSVFSAAGSSEARYVYSRDRTDGRYANAVQAYSSGEGEDQPNSAFAIDADALAAGAPIWELHFQPSSSITTQSVLDAHAAAKLALLRDGTNVWRITARWDAYPRLNIDARLGDDVGWDLIGHRHPEPGVTGQARMIGWELDMQAGTWSPILQEEAT